MSRGKGWGNHYLYEFRTASDEALYRGRTREFTVRSARHAMTARWWGDVDHGRTQVWSIGYMTSKQANDHELNFIASNGGTLANHVGNQNKGRWYRPSGSSAQWWHPQPMDWFLHWAATLVPLVFLAVCFVLLVIITIR